jgi:hypothetical protein
MIDFHKELVSALQTVLPTHYEMTLTSGTEVPCISYMERNNYVAASGGSQGYSYISYQVKVWGHNIGEIQRYALMVDNALRPLGFKRVSSQELYDHNSTMIQKIMTFEALGREQYN